MRCKGRRMGRGRNGRIMLWIVTIIMILAVIGLANVSAIDFDNSKSKLGKGKAGYDNIRIKNAFGLGTTLWEGELTKNTDTCGISCSAEKTITIYDTGSLIDDVRFETITEDDRYEQNIRSYQFYIKTNEEEFDVDDYEYQCVETGKVSGNGTKEQTCSNVKVGSHKENRPLWEEYSLGQELPAGTYEVKLEGSKKPSRTVDWQIKSAGIWIDDWAIWGGNTDIFGAYWKFNEGSGNAIDFFGRYNGTNDGNVNFVAGKLNNASNYTADKFTVGNVLNLGAGEFTIAGWYKTDTNAVYNNIIGKSDGATGNAWGIQLKDNRLSFRQDATATYIVADPQTSNDGIWHHFVIMRNSTDYIYLYVNGTLKASASDSTDWTNTHNLYLGSADGSNKFTGYLDNFILINGTAWTHEEILADYNEGIGREYGNYITLNSPEDNYVSITNDIDFNCSATASGGATITNISLWTNASGTWDIAQTKALPQGMVMHYNFDETSGNIIDRISGVYNGTVSAGMERELETGVVLPKAYNFGTGANVINITSMPIDGEAGTILFWWQTGFNKTISQTGTHYIMSGSSDNYRGILQTGSTELEWVIGGNSLTKQDLNFDSTTWNLVGLSWNLTNDNYTFMINDEFTGSEINAGGVASSPTEVVFGGYRGTGSPEYNYTGNMSELYVWDREITQAELETLYNNGIGIDYSSTDLIFTESITDPTLWTCSACDSDGDCGFASENRTVDVDAVAPQVTLSPSTYDYHQAGNTLIINFTVTDTNLDSCWYTYSSVGFDIYEPHGEDLDTDGGSVGYEAGVEIVPNKDIILKKVTLANGVTAAKVKVYNETGTELAVSNIADLNATFDIQLTSGKTYYIVANDTTYTRYVENGAGFPYSNEYFDYTDGIYQSGGWTGSGTVIFNVLGIDVALDNIIDCADNNLSLTATVYDDNDLIFYANDSVGNLNTTLWTWTYKLFEESSSFNATTYETATESYRTWFNGTGTISSANLIQGSTSTAASVSGNKITASKTLSVGASNQTYWDITLSDATNVITNNHTQTVGAISMGACNATLTVPYLNFTFKNETVAQEDTTAFISESTWEYYLGDGSVTKSFSYSNVTELGSYSFCFSPTDRTVKADMSISYDNSETQQRSYSPNLLTLTNTTTNTTLFLLPTGDGIFVTFQVINPSDNPIEGAEITITRSGYGIITQVTTGASGTASIFLNPNFEYTLTVTATNYASYTTTQTFPNTEYTINLGQVSTSVSDYMAGVTYQVRPMLGTLANNTDYVFNFTIQSVVWNLDEYGYFIYNESDYQMATNSGTTDGGGYLGSTVNTGNNSLIHMDYYWVINSSYFNSTVYWTVTADTGGSVRGFFARLDAYMGDGIFGISKVGIAIVMFLIIFIFTGVLSYKFGLNSPEAIMYIAFFAIALFDAGLGIITFKVQGLLTFVAGLILIGNLLRRNL